MPFLLANWRLIAEAAILGVLLIALGVQTTEKRHYKAKAESVKAEFDGFKLKVAQLGEAAQADAKRKETENAERIRKAEADAASARSTLARWVSESRARGGFVPGNPGAPAGTSRAGQVCYDAAELDAAIRGFRDEVAGLVAEGESAVIATQQCVRAWPQ